MKTGVEEKQTTFQEHVIESLSRSTRRIDSRYLYDDRGSELFKEIMHLREYYLTDCEHEIFTEQAGDIVESLMNKIDGNRIHIIELGCGDGLKTRALFEGFEKKGIEFEITAIDISQKAITQFESGLKQDFNHLSFHGICDDFVSGLNTAMHSLQGDMPAVVLFLGSNIGNFSKLDATDFLKKMRSQLRPFDSLLLGVDLKKAPEIMQRAYDDSEGVTAAFNLNLLDRINRELDANFDRTRFQFHCYYDPLEGCIKSFLLSLDECEVTVAGEKFFFDRFEPIHTEVSHKYSRHDIQLLGKNSGMQIDQIFTDRKYYFADCILSPA